MSFQHLSLRPSWRQAPVALAAALLCSAAAQAQTVFLDTFGPSVERATSPYVPDRYVPGAGMDDTGKVFSHGDQFYHFADVTAPAGEAAGEANNRLAVDNGYYAVGHPQQIGLKSPYLGQSWYQFLPSILAADHTGDGGSVLAINAGEVRNEFYRRAVSLTPGTTYKLSAAVFVTKSPVAIRFEVQDGATGAVLAQDSASGVQFFAPSTAWSVHDLQFTVPASCNAAANYSVALRNAQAANGGNDFYIDDVALEVVSTAAPNLTACPSATPNVKAENDAWPIAPGGTSTGTVFDNDTTDPGSGSTGTTTSNVKLTPVSTPPGITLNPNGSVVVDPSVTPGSYVVDYRICNTPVTTSWPVCDEAKVTITVANTPTTPSPTPSIDAVNDDFSATPVAPGGSTTDTVLVNDLSNGTPATLQGTPNVSLKPTPQTPTGFSFDSTGRVVVDAQVVPGSYVVPYQICLDPATQPATCDDAEATVVVAATGTGTPPSPAASVQAVPVNSLGALGALAGLLAWGAARRRKVR